MTKVLVSAALLALAGLCAAPAAAAPAPAPHASPSAADIVQVQAGRPDGHRGRGRDFSGDGRHFTPGHRYQRAPSHWRRYHSRPRDWRHRGCVIVGPLWFCP